MFMLVSGLWRWWTEKEELRFLVIGLDNAGKTTTLEQIKRNFNAKTPQVPLEGITPTIGLNLCRCDFNRRTSLIFWDLGGQLMLRGIWANHYEESDGVIFVIDSTDRNRLGEVKLTLEQLISALDTRRQLPILLLINKQDICQEAVPIANILEVLSPTSAPLPTIDNSAHIPIIPYVSASSQYNIPRSADDLSQLTAKRRPFVLAAVECSAMNNINIKNSISCLVDFVKIIKPIRM